MESYQYVADYLASTPFIIQLMWAISAIFFISIIFLGTYLKFLRSYLRKKELVMTKYKNEYESDLINYLYAGSDEEAVTEQQQIIITKLRSLSVDKFKRKIIVSTFLRLRNEISGEMADSIQKLYFQSGFINYALVRLKSKKWHIVAAAIRELTQLQVKEVQDEILALVNHPKPEIQKEVQLYLVTLFNFKGLEFLNILKSPLSEWNQIQLLEVLQRFDEQELPNITPWLQSSNNYVVIFSLKLAKMYNQFELKDALLELLTHPSIKIRIDAIDVLGHLQIIEAKNILKEQFNTLSMEEQFAFLKLLENLYEKSDEPFLLEHINHENFKIKLTSLTILKMLNVEKFKSLKTFSEDSDFVKIFNFLENN